MDDTHSLSDNVAISALVVSLVALLMVILQLTQAIVATARGLQSTDVSVMGLWAKRSSTKWRWFRIELEYEAPVFFLAHSDNPNGPVVDDDGSKPPIWYADGSSKSCENTLVSQVGKPIDEEIKDATPKGIRTVNNELATWVTLIEAIQMMERDSRNWETKKWRASGIQRPELQMKTTLAVGIQRRKRRFESHPDINRPFATTTVSHIVELAAVLGLHWKEFNRDNNKYHAEGNGYSLLGSRESNFGIVFVFERTGQTNFEKTRVIPTYEVKELCFGNIPTFYRPKDPENPKNPKDLTDERAWGFPHNEQIDLKTLQLGSRKEIGETLNLIGCNTQTLLYYLRENQRHIHLFPVTFEIIGMLGRTIHIRDRSFTYAPNPTIFPWNRQSFSLRRLLKAFRRHMSDEVENAVTVPTDLQTINAQAGILDRDLPPNQDSDFEQPLLNKLHDALDVVDGILDEGKISKTIVLDVLRRHLQEVLLAINTSVSTEAGAEAIPDGQEGSVPQPPSRNTVVGAAISFDDLLSLPPENREIGFMRTYFNEIRPRVINTSKTHHDSQAADASRVIHNANPQPQQQHQQDFQNQNQAQNLSHNESNTAPPTAPTAPDDRTTESIYDSPRNYVWCALVFRMICWLLLHDFDKQDVQLPKSELMGSRQSVYIV